MIIHSVTQRSQAWHDLRVGRITGSVWKALKMGKTTKGYRELIATMASEMITGVVDEMDEYKSGPMDRGTDLEPEALKVLSDIIPGIREVGFITPDEGSEFEDWIGASPDAGIFEGDKMVAGLELKCPFAKTHFRYFDEGLPKEYQDQVQSSLFISGLDLWYFVSYYPQAKPFIFEIAPDRERHKIYETDLREAIHQTKKIIKFYDQYEYGYQDEN